MMNEKNLNEIKARAEAATPGPWEPQEGTKYLAMGGMGEAKEYFVMRDGDDISICCDCSTPNGIASPENADFIAHARTDVPALVAEVERLNNLVEALAIAVEDETSMLSDAPLTAEKLEEILHTLKHRYENANEFLGDYVKETMLLNSEVERLKKALEFYAKENNWEEEGDGKYWTVQTLMDGGDIARKALKGGEG